LSILGFATAAIGPVANAVGKWQERRSQVAQAKHESKLERIRNLSSDWKDEWLIIIWSYPMISMFIPIDAIQQATFDAMDKIGLLPEWFVGGWVAISLAIFGVDKLIKVKR
jgi:hypothetical protein